MRRLAVMVVMVLVAVPACARGPQSTAGPSEIASATPTQTPTSPATLPPSGTPAPTDPATAPDDPATAAPTGSGPLVELWFLRETTHDGELQASFEPEMHALDGPTRAVARATMELLLRTPPRDPALMSLVPRDTRLLGVDLADGILTVDLHFSSGGIPLGALYEGAFYSQIHHTGAQFPGVRKVGIQQDGGEIRSGHYENPGRPMRADEIRVSPVIITTPYHEQTVPTGNVTVTGTANVYEATVLLRLRDSEGTVIERDFTTATCGTGCRGDWTHTFTVPQSGTYTLVASASDPSDGEGPPPYRTRRTFRVGD